MVPASRPLMTFADTAAPDVVTPRLMRQNPRALAVYERAMAEAWAAKNRLLELGVPLEYALYVLPNAKALRLVESGSFLSLQHKWTLRTCFNAQEEIYLASMDEIAQVRDVHPRLGPLPRAAVRAAQQGGVAALHRGHALLRRAGVEQLPATPCAGCERGGAATVAIMAWLAHLYTALGAGTALAAVLATRRRRSAARRSCGWRWPVFIDATDGVLARALRVKERLPWFDGAMLDNLVDYLTYVFVPALIVRERRPRGRRPLAPSIGAAMLIASGYGFSRSRRQGGDHRPLLHRLPVLLEHRRALHVRGLAPAGAAQCRDPAALVVLVFVPLRYVYPSRTPDLAPGHAVLGVDLGGVPRRW